MLRSWTVERSAPVDGIALPMFIYNCGTYFCCSIDVFADGVVDCWGAVDLQLFKENLDDGWVQGSAIAGSPMRVEDLGQFHVEAVSGGLTSSQIQEPVRQTVAALNPSLQGLVDMQGDHVDRVGGLPLSKISCHTKSYRFGPDSRRLFGDRLQIFRENGDSFKLTRWFIYQDGMSQLDDGPVRPLQEIILEVRSGAYITSLPEGGRLDLGFLGSYIVHDGTWFVELDDLIREAADLVLQCNGQPGLVQLAMDAFEEYLRSPNTETLSLLRTAYENVPEHLRSYCGDQDTKDIPIRMAIYGPDEIEGWSHRIVSRQLGMELPEIYVPNIKDSGPA